MPPLRPGDRYKSCKQCGKTDFCNPIALIDSISGLCAECRDLERGPIKMRLLIAKEKRGPE